MVLHWPRPARPARTAALPWLLALGLAALVGGDSCPSSCFCDAQLSVTCEGDTLWRFPDGIPSGVVRLELRSYVIPVLTAAQLGGFTNLTELKASRNRITAVENGTFSALTALLKLDLSQNMLSEVTAETLAGLTQTKNLDLSSNRLSSVEGAFAGLSSLEQLTLRSNNITSLQQHTLMGLPKLQYLNLDSNLISHIDVSAFQGLATLAHLILSNNPLSNLSRLEFFGSRLQYIDVSAVGLTRVPQSLTHYVRDLRLAKNSFSVLRRGDFDSYPYLGLLVLDDSGVRELEEDSLGRHEHLMRLWLNGNLLRTVPASLPPSLKALYLEENRVSMLRRDDFKGLTALEQLFMQRNLIVSVEDCAFCGLSSLKNLELQTNKIQHVSAGSFSGLTSLESLDLSQNPLTAIEPRAFSSLLSLRCLQLSRLKANVSVPDSLFDALERLDQLEMFDSAPLVSRVIGSGRLLHGIRSVRHLNVMHNQLTRLRPDLPSLLPRLQLLKLGGNWWNCSDPDILWLTDWMAEGRVKFYSPYSARCRQPARLMLSSVAMLTDSDFETVPTRPRAATAQPGVGVTPTADLTAPLPAGHTTSTTAAGHPASETSPGDDTTSSSAPWTTAESVVTSSPSTAAPTAIRRTQPPATTAIRRTQPPATTAIRRTQPPATTAIRRTQPPATTAAERRTTPPTQVPEPPATVPRSDNMLPAPSTDTPTKAPMGYTVTNTPTQPSTSSSSTTAATTQPPATSTTSPRPDAATTSATSLRPGVAATSARRPPATEAGVGSRRPADPRHDPGRERAQVNYVATGSGGRGTMVAVVTSMAAAVGVMLLLLLAAVCLWRYRHASVYPFTRRRKGSSISYSQQKDEVNIMHDSCGSVPDSCGSVPNSCGSVPGSCGSVPDSCGSVPDGCGSGPACSDTHHGLSNVLYFMAQRGEAELADRRTRPTSLLPQSTVDACPRAVSDAWATPSPDAGRW